MKPKLCPGNLVVVTEDVFGEYQQAEKGDVGRFLEMDGPYAVINFSGHRKTIHPSFLICLNRQHWSYVTPSETIIRVLEALDKVEGGDPLTLHELGIKNQLATLQEYLEKYSYNEAKAEVDSVIDLLDIYPSERLRYPDLPRYFRRHLGKVFLCLLCPERQTKVPA